MAKVSVIIPCYNAENFITRCLDGLKAQTFQDFEAILVDDCSKDNTVEVIEDYQKTSSYPIHILKNEKNLGPGASRNKGIEAAESKYICFCDADDYYDVDYLEKMVNKAEEGRCDLVICGYKQVFESKKPICHEANTQENLPEKEKILIDIDSLCRVLIKREIALENPIPEIWNGEDMAVIPVWLSRAKTYGIVGQPLYNYLCREGSACSTLSPRTLDSFEKGLDYLREKLGTNYKEECEFIQVKSFLYGLVLALCKAGKPRAQVEDAIDKFYGENPGWSSNRYLSTLPVYKKFYISAIAGKQHLLLKLMTRVHTFLRA